MKYIAQFFCTQKIKKNIVAILILMSIASFFSYIPESYAASASAAYVESALKIHKTPALTQSQYNAKIDEIAQLAGGADFAQNRKGQWLNPHVFEHYSRIIVYGLPHGLFYATSKGQMFNSSGVQGEYQYLGYDYAGESVTNNYYFGGTTTGIFTTYKEVNWQPIGGAATTWGTPLKEEQKNYLLNTSFYDGDFRPFGSITQPPLLSSWLLDYTNKAYIQSPPGLWRGASIRLEYGPGNRHWNTIDWNPMGCEFTGDLTPVLTSYTLKSTENEIEVSAKLSATFLDPSKLKHIEKVEYEFYSKKDFKTNATTGSTYTSNELKRTLNRGNLKTGTNQIELVGTVKVWSKYNEYKEEIVRKTITITVEESKGPYASATMSADPNKVKFNDKDMSTTLNIGYSAASIPLNQISKITLNVPGEGTYQATLSLEGSHQITVTIPASYMSGASDTKPKTYEVLVNYHLKDGTNLYAAASTIVEIYKNDPKPPTPPAPDNNPPTLRLIAPTRVKAGENFIVRANASDPDGDSLEYIWYLGNANGSAYGNSGTLWYSSNYIGTTQTIHADVTDGKDGVEDYAYVYVTEPTPTARITIGGTLKENRKVTIIDNSDSPERFPIINRLWTVTPIASSGTSSTDIKHSGDWISASDELLFKKAGQYMVTLRITNSAGYSDTTSRIIDVSPDIEPIADFITTTTEYRDTSQGGKATISIADKSYSIDNDTISKREWRYRYDSNNNGSYTDESWVSIPNSLNKQSVEFVRTEVGKYQVELTVTEEFGQDTIETFTTASDRKKAVKIIVVEVANLAPNVSLSMTDRKKVDLVFNVWDTKYTIQEINTAVNSIKPKLNAANIDVSYKIHKNYNVEQLSTYDPPTIHYAWTFDNWVYLKKSIGTIPSGYLYHEYIPDVVFNTSSYKPELTYIGSPNEVFGQSILIGRSDDNEQVSLRIKEKNSSSYEEIFTIGYKVLNREWWGSEEEIIVIANGENNKKLVDYHIDTGWSKGIQVILTALKAEGNIVEYTISVVHYKEVYDYDKKVYNKVYDFILKDATFQFKSSYSINREREIYFETRAEDRGAYPATAHAPDIYSGGYFNSVLNDNSIYLNSFLNTLTFREGAEKYLITISDREHKDLKDTLASNSVLSKLKVNNISFIGLGTNRNKAQYNVFIGKNNYNGYYEDNADLVTSLSGLADKLIGTDDSGQITKYILLNSTLETNVFYSDTEDDPQYATRFIYTHTKPNYFDNSLGTMANSGVPLVSPITTFNKVGAFEVALQVRDNPKATDNRFDNYRLWSEPAKMTVYVHRRPIAEPKLTYTTSGYYHNLVLTDTSYDLDHTSRADKGIVEKIWSYKDATDPNAAWIEGKLERVPVNKPLYIKLAVMDMEYTWDEKTIYFNPDKVDVPDAILTILPEERNTWANANISASINYSNPAIFSKIRYRVTASANPPTSGTWTESTNATVPVSISQEGIRYVHAQGIDNLGGTIAAIGGPYRIDKTPPTISVSKSSGNYEGEVSVEITATDALSGFKFIKYAWSTSATAPASNSSSWTESNSPQNIASINVKGSYYLHIQATDNANNTRTARYGLYTIIINRPPTVSILGTTPSFIYEGDNVTVNFIASDPDLDTLTCNIEIKKGSTTAWTGTRIITPSGGVYPIVNLPTIPNISTGSYTVSVTVKDAQNVIATDIYTFNVYALGITGSISHTELWERHRQKYNAAAKAAGREEHAPEVFFEGEMFVVSADTTVINPQSNVSALNVQVGIVGTSFSTYLGKTSNSQFYKGWWEESMPRWGVRPLDFLFRVTYSNGVIKTHTVRIYISGDDYWRLRLLF